MCQAVFRCDLEIDLIVKIDRGDPSTNNDYMAMLQKPKHCMAATQEIAKSTSESKGTCFDDAGMERLHDCYGNSGTVRFNLRRESLGCLFKAIKLL